MILRISARLYRYVFYKLYRWSEAVNARHEKHELNAVIMLSAVIGINLLTIPVLYQILTRYKSIDTLAALTAAIPAYYAVVVAGVIFLVNYILLAHKIGYRKILKEFEEESTYHRKLGNILVTSYVIGSFMLLFSAGFFAVLRY